MNFYRIRIVFRIHYYGGGKKRETARQAIQTQFNNPNDLVQAHSNDRSYFKGYKLTLYMKL